MKKSQVSARVDKDVKEEAEDVLETLGLNTSTAINAFLRQVIRRKGLPFALSLEPNEATKQALRDSREGNNLSRYDTPEEAFDDLGI